MRIISLLMTALLFTGCELVDNLKGPQAVDPSNLPPLSGREQALLFAADGAFQQGNFSAAERDYLAAAGASAGHVEAHLAAARFYEKQHQTDKEREILLRALALQPYHPIANYRLGKLHMDGNRYAEALAAFRKGREKNPENVDLSIGEAVTQDMLGQHAHAQTIYEHIIATHPSADLASLRTNLGMSYLLGGDAKKAAATLAQGVKPADMSQVTRHNLALAYGVLGRTAEAKALLKGEMDEETRLLAIARLKEYWQDRAKNIGTPPLKPSIALPEEKTTDEKAAATKKPAP